MEYVSDYCGYAVYTDGADYFCPDLHLRGYKSDEAIERAIRKRCNQNNTRPHRVAYERSVR